MSLEIKKTNWGVANTYHEGNKTIIEVNEKLYDPKYKPLLNKILQHESEHHHAKGFWANRKVDALTEVTFKDLLPFYRENKKAFFQQHSPISYRDGIIFLEWSLILLYSLYGGISFGIFFLIKWFSDDSIVFWAVVKNILWILPVALVSIWLLKKFIKVANKEAIIPQ